jgi:hypothetical protein
MANPTNHQRLEAAQVDADFSEATAAAVVAEAAEALALEGTTVNQIDWVYSATAEGLTGEVAVGGIDLDGEPGLIYGGPLGAGVRVSVANVDVDHGLIAPEATDTAVVALFVNNTVVAYADEGFTAELDAEPAIEFNLDTYVGPLSVGDVLRVGIIGGTEETLDLDVALGGSLMIT